MSDSPPPLQPAYYSALVSEFLCADPDAIYGALSRHHAHTQEMTQRSAWLEQIALLQKGLTGVPDAWLAFEFAIPRMGKRADAIIILDGVIFVIEFKIRAATFETAAIDQVTDYALDLKNFHSHSHLRILVPVIIATEAPARPIQLDLFSRDVTEPVLSNGHNLAELLTTAVRRYQGQPPLSPEEWMASGYKPTPTIIKRLKRFTDPTAWMKSRAPTQAPRISVSRRRVSQRSWRKPRQTITRQFAL